MSNDGKKPGPRDISDLKARLGLKKGGETGRNPAAGGVPPPGGGKLAGSYVPPPPGVAPPPGAPQQPQIPDATVDPFAAMNALAAQAAARAAPEIIVVKHGEHEQVHKGFPVRRVLVVLGVLLTLVVGFILGGINYERKEVGATIGAAAVLKKEVSDVGKKLQSLQDSLFRAKDRAKDKQAATPYILFDSDLMTEIETADLGLPKDDETQLLIYNANLYTMDRKLIADSLMFYAHLRTLQERIDTHARIVKEDSQKNRKDALEAVPDLSKAGAPLGVILRVQPGKDNQPPKPYVELVQLGAPVCADKLPHPEGCQPVEGYQFRTDTGSPWGSMEFVKDQPAVDKIMPIGVTGILNILVRGSEKTTEEAGYFTRLQEIESMVEDLITRRKDIENRMNTLAQRNKPLAI